MHSRVRDSPCEEVEGLMSSDMAKALGGKDRKGQP
jgi:hypothetical protein